MTDPYFLILVLMFALLAGVAIWLIVRDRLRVEAQQSIHRRELQGYSDAEADYNKAMAALEAREGKPIVLDLINDLSYDPIADLASDVPDYLDFSSAEKILAKIKAVRDGQPIDIVIHTLGGFSLAAELIAAALHARGSRTRTYVPYIAMSGGTLVALSTETVCLGKNAALGPVDTQYWGFPAESYAKLLSEKSRDATADFTLLRSYEVDVHSKYARRQACDLVHKAHKRLGDATDGTCVVVHRLTDAERSHSNRVTFDDAKGFGMQVQSGCPQEVYDLVDARLQMIRARQRQIRERFFSTSSKGRSRFR
jgi:ClpP class serine protease